MTASADRQHHHALITGASSGIGRAFAIELAQQSKKISILGRNAGELEVTKNLLIEKNPDLVVEVLISDLTSEADRKSLVQKLKSSSLDLLVLNAGGGAFNHLVNSSWEVEKNVIALNVAAPTHLTTELLPTLIASAKQKVLTGHKDLKKSQKSGLIIVSSHAAFIRTPHFSVYGACKSYLNYFGLTLRQELDPNQMEILVVCPGATQTQFSKRAGLPQKMISPPMTPERVAQQSLKQLGKTNLYIVAPFDRIIYLASRLLPICIFDAIVGRLQARLLKSSNVS